MYRNLTILLLDLIQDGIIVGEFDHISYSARTFDPNKPNRNRQGAGGGSLKRLDASYNENRTADAHVRYRDENGRITDIWIEGIYFIDDGYGGVRPIPGMELNFICQKITRGHRDGLWSKHRSMGSILADVRL